MRRERYYIVRIQHSVVPSVVSYVGHGETPYDLNMRFAYFRDSATQYSSKRDAIREAKRYSKTFPGQWKVVGECSSRAAFDSMAASQKAPA
jgi:hypothetical protein